jgi:transcriptional regulator
MLDAMAGSSTDLLQGTLDLLILKTLALEPMHGFGIARRIEQVSEGVFRVNPGSLLVAFRRLERDGFITGEWRDTDNRRRACFYRLTATGRGRLKAEARDWDRRVAAMARLLESS